MWFFGLYLPFSIHLFSFVVRKATSGKRISMESVLSIRKKTSENSVKGRTHPLIQKVNVSKIHAI